MDKIYISSRGADDWRQFLADPVKHWKSRYSAKEAALSWEGASPNLPPEFIAILGQEAELLLAIPEHKVALPGGRRESQCDVFALVGVNDKLISLAVEAKVNEPFGPTINEWLESASTGKTARLKFICDLLGCELPAGHLRYQLLHRTAAAILEARRFRTQHAAMIIQSFSPSHKWFEDFEAFCGFLGSEVVLNEPVEFTLPNAVTLTLGWAACQP